MELFVVDAFTNQLFGGNQAGVALIADGEAFPDAETMRQIAAELKHAETAFVQASGPKDFTLRYFAAEGEVSLCGHATVSTFTALRNEKRLPVGSYTAHTKAGDLRIEVEPDLAWLEMAPGKLIRYLTDAESEALYRAYSVGPDTRPGAMRPCIVDTGLADILLPVGSQTALNNAVQDCAEVARLSEALNVIGVHMFCYDPSPEATAYCRNFAPFLGINEEAATGTANGALTYFLLRQGLVSDGDTCVFRQGIAMGRPSVIRGKVAGDRIFIGGNAVVSITGQLHL